MPFGAKIQLSPTLEITIETASGGKPIEAQKNLIEACSFWQELPSVCPMPGCGHALIFFTRHPQTYHYYGLKCLGPVEHEMNLSERRDGTSFYIKDDAWHDAPARGSQADEPAPAQASPQSAPASAPAVSPTGDTVDAGTIRMIQAVANGKNPKPDVDGLAQQFFSKPLAACSKSEAMAVLEYLKTL